MMLASGTLMATGGSIALMLLLMGIVFGMRIGRRHSDPDHGISQRDRERTLQLLHELGTWTSEYSGNVTEYQDKLGEIREAVRQNKSPGEIRVVALLQEIMTSNDILQSRLNAAEQQLEKQTKQIESYLTEARTDGLTGLYNRRAFDHQLEEIFASFRKGGRPFVLVLIDIDHFKAINDSFGHQAGDDVLQQLAKTLDSRLEDAIIVARFGGEEFAVIMDGPLQVAAERMNELRRLIARQRPDIGNADLEITVSIGLSAPRDDIVPGPIIRRADEALYAAKNMGRDRVYYHDGKGPTLVGAPEVVRNSSES